MTTLVPTEEEVMLADAARGFLDAAAPLSHLRAMRDEGRSFDPALWREMAQMGWAGVLVPEDQGGSDMGHGAACVLARELGRTLALSPFLSSAVMAATALRQSGSGRARAIAGGELTYALAVDENAKFDPEAIETEARKHGNGFRLRGEKSFVVGGVHADRLLVLVRTSEGPSLFDIAADQPGITRAPRAMIDASDAARVTLLDVDATGDDLIGAPGEGLSALRPALEAGQAALAAEMTGLSASAVGMTTQYLKDRTQFGMPIGSFQALQHRAAHLWCETEVTASAVIHAGRQLDADPENATLAVSLAKARACETSGLAVREGVQMHGGIGMTDAHDMGFFMKRARVAAEWLGDYGYHAEQVARLRGF